MGTNLDGHVAVVTGSAMGMGKVTAKELASRGAAVACWDIVGDKAMETAEEIKAAGWGRIVNISSGACRSNSRSRVIPYSAAKAGLLGLTRQLAVDLAPHGVNVNAIAPGAIATLPNAAWKKMPADQQRDALLTIPAGRFGESEEIAGAIAFLVSDDASYVIGQTLCVDGGHWMF